MATSDSDLEKKREHNRDLRARLAAAKAQQADHETRVANDLVAAQLDAEAARLSAELEAVKQHSKVRDVRAGAEVPLEAAKEEMRRAAELEKAQKAAADSGKEN